MFFEAVLSIGIFFQYFQDSLRSFHKNLTMQLEQIRKNQNQPKRHGPAWSIEDLSGFTRDLTLCILMGFPYI